MNLPSDDRAAMLPTGVFEMPPERAAFMRQAEDTLLRTFRRWGYQEVRTPAMEYVDAMALALDHAELDRAFKMVDRLTGRMMVLRSDVTPQVARMAALALQGLPRPLRLCYVADVYRHPSDPSNPRTELIQAGAELIGLADPQGDAELVALAVESLRSLGLGGVRISLGQTRYARGLLERCGLGRGDEDRLMAAAHRKDAAGLTKELERAGVDPALRPPILALAELGGDGDRLDRILAQAPSGECRQAVENLAEVMDLAASYGVDREAMQADLGELASFRYHTGLVFTGYVGGAGRAVLRGGRYDHLVGRYGVASPATGFAIDILELAEIASVSRRLPPAVDYLLVNRSGDRRRGLRLAMELRARGRDVLCLIRGMEEAEMAPFARSHRIGAVVVLEADGGVSRLDPSSGRKGACKAEEL